MEKIIYEIAEGLGLSDIRITLLAGDASTRKYYRIEHSGGSFVLMKGEPFSDGDPNLQSLKAYSHMGINVPAVHKIFPELGVIIQQDVGDLHLQLIKDTCRLKKYYKEAVDVLVAFQRKAFEHEKEGTDLYPNKVRFTHEKFMSELNMTTEYYINGIRGGKGSGLQKSILHELYVSIVDEMMKQPFLLQHRDYHSRNLMVHSDKLYVIDIQDSRLGPFAYDIASLVIDPYIELGSALYDDIINSYYDGIKDIVKCDHSQYLRFYNLCFLQRGIKILGTFAYQKINKNNPNYLRYIPVSVEKIKKVSAEFPDWNDVILKEILL
jgi:N-acetylmuramate 1-kinase